MAVKKVVPPDKSSSPDNYSDDLVASGGNVNIDTMGQQELDDFFTKQNEKMHSICQKSDHPLYKAIAKLNDTLLEQNALLEAKADFMKKVQKKFVKKIVKINTEMNEKLKELQSNTVEQDMAYIEEYDLTVSPFVPLSLKDYLQSFIQLSDKDKERVKEAVQEIKAQLLIICQQADALISPSKDLARLGTLKHRYCQSILEGIQQTKKFKGISSLKIESSYKGQSVLKVEQKPDIYWEQGGVVIDYKFGERSITTKDKAISSQVLPHYTESYQMNL